MTATESTSLLQEHLLPGGEKARPLRGKSTAGTELIVVLKQHRFYKQLCIELYEAPTTQAGKIKNPLIFVPPLDRAWQTEGAAELKFLSAIARFQLDPTSPKSPSDIEALKAVCKNPLGLRFFYHNADFSENVVAGSLVPVAPGPAITDMTLFIDRKEDFYEVRPQVTIQGRPYPFADVQVLYDYFLLTGAGTLHLLGDFYFLKPVLFFKQVRPLLRIHQSRFKAFQESVLVKLQDRIALFYCGGQGPTREQSEEQQQTRRTERFLYLSDLDHYVLLNPVMKYGEAEIPVRTKRQLYATDSKGTPYTIRRDDAAETAFVALLLRQHPLFSEQLEEDLPYFYLHKERFLDEEWFLNAFEEWQRQGISVLGFNELKNNKLNPHKAKVSVQVTSGLNWFATDVDVRFGKKKASLKQLHQSIRNKKKFVLLDDGTLGILPQEWMEKLAAYFSAGEVVGEQLLTPKVGFATVAELYDAEMLDEAVKGELAFYATKVASFEAIADVETPAGLKATLRPYQRHGLAWLNFLDEHNFGGCLADDMGLGKTVQVLAFVLHQRTKRARNTNLLVVPTSLVFNWLAEVQKFAPSLKILTLQGANRPRDSRHFDDYELLLTTYGTLLSDINFLKRYEFNYIFLDESQNIKNIESQRYQAARLLKSRNKVAITGTPVENNSLDLYGQLSFACPGLLGGKRYFRDVYSVPIDKFKSSKRAAELQRKVAPFILRRTKKGVAAELPEKTEMVLYCPMTEGQQKAYDACAQEVRDFIAGQAPEELSKSSMHVLRGLTRLRQICNSPLLLPDEKLYGDGSSKIETLLEQIGNQSGRHKILVFSQFVSMLDLIRKELTARGIDHEYLTGSTGDREGAVRRFQDDPGVRAFLISLKAGGTGLNLTEADYVYLVDPWWNPAVENQAIDRAYRIGQEKHVVAVRLICPGTVEEKILRLQETKKELSGHLVQTDSSMLKALTKEDLLSLLG